MGFIVTASGKKVYPLEPTTEMVDINDIAHALSKIARWTGHTKGDNAYSVAQHAVLTSLMVPEEYALEALHHDSSEAYIADIAKPLKASSAFSEYRYHEKKLTRVIYTALGIPYTGRMSAHVELADVTMLWTEARELMPALASGEQWFDPNDGYPQLRIDSIWPSSYAKEAFLSRHNTLIQRSKDADNQATA